MRSFPYMETVRVRLDEALLSAVDEAAVVGQETRSGFIRAALQAELKRRQNAAAEEAHCQSRSRMAQSGDDAPGLG